MRVTVSSKGQITIPRALRQPLGLVAQMELDISVSADGRLVLTPMDGRTMAQRVLARLQQVPNRGQSAESLLAMTRGEVAELLPGAGPAVEHPMSSAPPAPSSVATAALARLRARDRAQGTSEPRTPEAWTAPLPEAAWGSLLGTDAPRPTAD
jgi:AbrB family looped-hinge helix DNA binding protein